MKAWAPFSHRPASAAPRRPRSARTARIGAWAAVAAVLAAVFAAYLQPQMMFDLATRVWACF